MTETVIKRYDFVDLARGLAVIFMVAVHVLYEMSTDAVYYTLFGGVVDFLGGPPAAPVFMFLMGVSMMFSKSQNLKKGVARGLKLLAAGYALNICRSTLPMLLILDGQWGRALEEFGYPMSLTVRCIDILQFAGVGFILLSLVRRFVPGNIIKLVIAAAVALMSPMLWGITSGIAPVDWLLELLWGDNGDWVAFPVFPWLCYPLFGMVFGDLLKKNGGNSVFIRKVFLSGLIILIIGSIFVVLDEEHHFGDYWRHGFGGVLWMTGFILLELTLMHLLVRRIPGNPVFSFLRSLSRNVASFYFIHWVLIGWLGWFLIYDLDSIPLMLVVTAFITALSYLLTLTWKRLRMKILSVSPGE